MIQKTNVRQPSSSSTPLGPSQTQGREVWGKWVRGKHYSLEIVQHPLRARMCGFGDKDRRPLAPAAVAKLVVRREDDSLVDVEEIDYTFFLATVDLWSEDCQQEMNLVLHPTSADRYVPSQGQKTRRRATARTARHSESATPTPASTTGPGAYNLRSHNDQLDNEGDPSTSASAPYQPAYPAAVQPHQPTVDSAGYPPVHQAQSEWNYHTQQQPNDNRSNAAPVLPSIQTFGRSGHANEHWQQEEARNEPEAPPYRAWPPDATYGAVQNGSTQNIDPSLRSIDNTQPSHPDPRTGGTAWNQAPPLVPGSDGFPQQGRYPAQQSQQEHTGAMSDNATSPMDALIYSSASYAQNEQYYQPSQDTFQPGSNIALPRHTYTRTLVGPLCANASRLSDEHRKPGIFFLFQDLSIRTEGVFCLRIRLMNVGAPPAPDPGAVRVHGDTSPVLAQIFTEPFTVYSAKRFPGVPDTTALSIAFGNQGQKLPLRNRHGSTKTRKRQRSVSDGGSEDESD